MAAAIDVVVEGRYAYVADFARGLVVVDIGNPMSPRIVGQDWVLGLPDSIAKSGDRVFLGTGLFGVQVIDVSDASHPTWVESICTDDIVVDVSTADGLLMVTGLLDGVVLYAVSLTQEAQRLGTYMPRCWAEDTAYYGGMMYVKGLGDTMEIVDVKNPATPKRVAPSAGARFETKKRLIEKAMERLQ